MQRRRARVRPRRSRSPRIIHDRGKAMRRAAFRTGRVNLSAPGGCIGMLRLSSMSAYEPVLLYMRLPMATRTNWTPRFQGRLPAEETAECGWDEPAAGARLCTRTHCSARPPACKEPVRILANPDSRIPHCPDAFRSRVRATGVETSASLRSMTESAEPGGKDGLHRAGQQVAQPACGHVIVQPLVPQQFDDRPRQTHG